jgi:hypothetical protein
VVLGFVCCYVRLLEGMEMRIFAVEGQMPSGQSTGKGQPGLEGGCGCVVVAMARVLSGYQRRGWRVGWILKRSPEKSSYGQNGVRGPVWISQSREV